MWILRKLFLKRSKSTPSDHNLRKSESSTGMLEAGDFLIDLDRRVGKLCGKDLFLTAEEFEVLVYLTRHPQHVVTQRTVLATCWTSTRPRQTDFLRVLLSLRKKLDAVADSGRHYLRTEPLLIYRFDPHLSF